MSEDRLSARPVFLFSFAFFLGGIIFVDLPFVFLITTSVVSLLSLLSQIFLKIGKSVKKFLFPVLFGILLSLVIVLCTVNAEKRSAEATVGKSDICEIEITTVVGTSPNFGSYYGRVISGNASKGLRVALTAQDGSLKPGDIIKCPTTFEKPSEEEIQRLSAQKIFLSCTVSDITYVGNNDSFSITRLFESINSRLSSRLKIYGGGALARAVLLGDKDELKLDVRRDFSRLGISHLLAVSGLHLSLIVMICEKLMNKCGVSKKNCSIVKVPLIVFYMGVTGFSSSVLRAGVMHLIKTAGDFVDRRSDPLTSLGAAVTLITVFDPYAFYDIGLILSALSAYACITFSFINKSRESSQGL